jgi:hypothetical protein
MAVDVEVDLRGFDIALSEASKSRALGVTTKVVSDDTANYVPVDTGALQSSGRMGTDVSSGVIEWDKEYANIVYNRDLVFSAGNPNGTPQWFEHAKKDHMGEWAEIALRELFGDYLE